LDSKKNTIANNAGLNLLANGCHLPIGMPAYGVRSAVFRKGNPLSPDELVGLSETPPYDSILDDYERKRGYHFPWGTLSEHVDEGDEEEEEKGVLLADFEFAPRDVFLAFPDEWHLADLFAWMYKWHPLRHRKFTADPDDVASTWSVISFQAKGEREIKSLRTWMVEVFIPLIWPELLNEAMTIIAAKKALVTSPDGSFEELLADRSRWLLCGDHKSLSFYKAR
jgi:hypothetical protein